MGQLPQASSQSPKLHTVSCSYSPKTFQHFPSEPPPVSTPTSNSSSAHTNCLPLSRNAQPKDPGLFRGTGLPSVVNITAGRDSSGIPTVLCPGLLTLNGQEVRRFGPLPSHHRRSYLSAWLSPSASDLFPDGSPRRSSRPWVHIGMSPPQFLGGRLTAFPPSSFSTHPPHLLN